MKWIVNIENKPNQRIVVNFNPLEEQLIFNGEYKPKNREWIVFSTEKYSMKLDLEKIQELLFITYENLKIRLEQYEILNEGFKLINLIEIKEEEEELG